LLKKYLAWKNVSNSFQRHFLIARMMSSKAKMEDAQVVIVGAGPSGLVLGLALAKQKIEVS
jgi:ribulose 1,5-bisphosphate synthetase/thiazole synthase